MPPLVGRCCQGWSKEKRARAGSSCLNGALTGCEVAPGLASLLLQGTLFTASETSTLMGVGVPCNLLHPPKSPPLITCDPLSVPLFLPIPGHFRCPSLTACGPTWACSFSGNPLLVLRNSGKAAVPGPAPDLCSLVCAGVRHDLLLFRFIRCEVDLRTKCLPCSTVPYGILYVATWKLSHSHMERRAKLGPEAY